MDEIKVGMADLATAKPPQVLVTTGLGSCVGVCLLDPLVKVGGLAHIMLPDSTQARDVQNKAKYADTAIKILIDEMVNLGAIKRRMVAKIAGGAQMFNFSGNNSIMKIGERNVEAVITNLNIWGIPILAQDTGGNYGRTIYFYPENGQLYIRTIKYGEKIV